MFWLIEILFRHNIRRSLSHSFWREKDGWLNGCKDKREGEGNFFVAKMFGLLLLLLCQWLGEKREWEKVWVCVYVCSCVWERVCEREVRDARRRKKSAFAFSEANFLLSWTNSIKSSQRFIKVNTADVTKSASLTSFKQSNG